MFKPFLCESDDKHIQHHNSVDPNHDLVQTVAEHLAQMCGGQAHEVCHLSLPTNKDWPCFGHPLAPDYPYINAEATVVCCRYVCTIEDVLC